MPCGFFQTIERLENMVEGGNYYEAQQMYKSTSARYVISHKARVGSLPSIIFSLPLFLVPSILQVLIFSGLINISTKNNR
jgi:hypothetical protein